MSKKTYQELKIELDEIMALLQDDQLDVDEMTKQYEQGMTIIKQLEERLKTAENTVKKIKSSHQKDS